MNAVLLHSMSLLALVAYAVATFSYARVMAPAQTAPVSAASLARKILLLGVACHLVFFLLTESSFRAPQNFPKTISFVSLALVGLFLVLERRLKISALGVFVAPSALVFFIMSAVAFHVGRGDGSATEGNLMLSLHLISTVFSYVLLFVAGCVSAALLVSESALKRKQLRQGASVFPPIVFLDRFYRALLLVGFGLLVFGMLTGVSATKLLGVEWGLMLRRLVWVLPEISVYSILLIMVYGFGFRGRRLSLMTLVGVLFVVGSLFAAFGGSGGFHAN